MPEAEDDWSETHLKKQREEMERRVRDRRTSQTSNSE